MNVPQLDIITAAVEVRKKAYAPYSQFFVGAALRDEFGNIHAGCNVENAAMGQSWCAETSAISALISSGAKHIKEVVVLGNGDSLCTPCGGCRQKIREFAAQDVIIHCCTEIGRHIRSFSLAEMLPSSFGPENLR